MPFEQLDRMKLNIKPLSERKDKVYIEKEHIDVEAWKADPNVFVQENAGEVLYRLRKK